MEINKGRIIAFITWLCRIIVGATFIYSGFVKGIDPWGTLYKFQEYIQNFGLNIWPNLLVTGVFGLCVFEFICGIFILSGCFRRSAPIFAAIFMVVMLPLTLWIAIKNPVADCGCFGDAFIISNWATFYKNIFLTILIIWLLRYNTNCRSLISPYLQWIAFLASGVFLCLIALFGYNIQPMIDFRPYKIGEQLISENEENQDTSEYEFIYEKNGIKKNIQRYR